MRVEYVDGVRAERAERGRGVNKTFLCLMLIILAFVVTGVLVLSRRMSDETLYLVAGIVIGLVPGGLFSLINSGVIGRRVSQLEMSLQSQRVERRPEAASAGGQPPGSVFVITPGGGVEQRRVPVQPWRGANDFEPFERQFRVVGEPRGSGRGAGDLGRGER